MALINFCDYIYGMKFSDIENLHGSRVPSLSLLSILSWFSHIGNTKIFIAENSTTVLEFIKTCCNLLVIKRIECEGFISNISTFWRNEYGKAINGYFISHKLLCSKMWVVTIKHHERKWIPGGNIQTRLRH